jgi:hypothetical protein
VYYPTLHLEIARYVQNAGLTGYELPWGVSRIIGSPPSAMCKPGAHGTPPPAPSRSTRASRTRGQASGPPPPTKRKTNLDVNGDGNGNGRKVTPAGLFDS